MLLGDAHIVDPVRKFLGQVRQAIALYHGSAYHNHPGVVHQHSAGRLGEDLAVGRPGTRALSLRGYSVVASRITLSRPVTSALGSEDMDNDRFGVIPGPSQRLLQLLDIVTVYRAHIGESEFLPHHGGHHYCLGALHEPS